MERRRIAEPLGGRDAEGGKHQFREARDQLSPQLPERRGAMDPQGVRGIGKPGEDHRAGPPVGAPEPIQDVAALAGLHHHAESAGRRLRIAEPAGLLLAEVLEGALGLPLLAGRGTQDYAVAARHLDHGGVHLHQGVAQGAHLAGEPDDRVAPGGGILRPCRTGRRRDAQQGQHERPRHRSASSARPAAPTVPARRPGRSLPTR